MFVTCGVRASCSWMLVSQMMPFNELSRVIQWLLAGREGLQTGGSLVPDATPEAAAANEELTR